MNTQHPAAARALAGYQPADPADLAYTLRTLNTLTGSGSVLYHLGTALDAWADTAATEAWPDGELVADMLRGADEHLGAVAEYLDKARAATGHWNGTEGSAA